MPDFTPNLTDSDRGRLNAADPTVQALVKLADAMDHLDNVTVSWTYARPFREVTDQPWAPCYDGVEISADDVVRPAPNRNWRPGKLG